MNFKELEEAMKAMDRSFKKVDQDMSKTFKDMEAVFARMVESLDEASPPKVQPWEKWFAWRPVKIKGKRRWMTTVYRRPKLIKDVDRYVHKVWEYGDMFDILKEAGK